MYKFKNAFKHLEATGYQSDDKVDSVIIRILRPKRMVIEGSVTINEK